MSDDQVEHIGQVIIVCVFIICVTIFLCCK